MGILDRFRKQPEQTASKPLEITASTRKLGYRSRHRAPDKFGSVSWRDIDSLDPDREREKARGVYTESLIARGIVTRFVDNVINVGLNWEASPMWDLLPGSPTSEKDRYNWTNLVEARWALYTRSKESTVEGDKKFSQLQRILYRTSLVDGEFFVVYRYLSDPKRMSPVSAQIIRSTQVVSPTDAKTLKAIEQKSHKIDHGIEYDSTGKKIAIYVQEPGYNLSKKIVRIPFYGNNRRFVSHHADVENPGQVRGISPLSALVYELDKLTEYDIAELEAVVSSALWIASIEADVNATPGRAPKIQPNFSNKDISQDAPKAGLETVEINGRALIMNNLSPGYSMKAWEPNRPNPNYTAFVEAFETHIAGSLGMPLSVARQKFGSSYSAARAELLLFWNSIQVRRDNFAVFLDEFYEAWFSEEVRSGRIVAPRFDQPVEHRAWLEGTWNGISRPNVDPLKEVNAVEKRLKLGHTTGEKEARAYNGSDYRENVERLKNENKHLAEANSFLDADLPGQDSEDGEENTGDDGDE